MIYGCWSPQEVREYQETRIRSFLLGDIYRENNLCNSSEPGARATYLAEFLMLTSEAEKEVMAIAESEGKPAALKHMEKKVTDSFHLPQKLFNPF